jgi:hypothetical protein
MKPGFVPPDSFDWGKRADQTRSTLSKPVATSALWGRSRVIVVKELSSPSKITRDSTVEVTDERPLVKTEVV